MSALLEVRGLRLELTTPQGPVPVVEGVDLTLDPAQTLALVGESGSGKSLTALAVMGLLPRAVRVVGGEIVFAGRDLLRLAPAERRALCGKEIAMSFQEPASALNPVLTIGDQVAESFRIRAGMSRTAARAAEREGVASLLVAGGVAANRRLRERVHEHAGVPVFIPPPALCTDNAAMIGAAAFRHLDEAVAPEAALDIAPTVRRGRAAIGRTAAATGAASTGSR